ncbi:MAG: SUMF1/EgtB/PvdO family nonheme iron enzyme, partial [Chitinophagales bacterium]
TYLEGRYKDYKPVKNIPYPEYRLPTIEEWEYLASGGLDKQEYPHGFDRLSKEWKKASKKDIQMFFVEEEGYEEPLHSYGVKEPFTNAKEGFSNKLGMLHTIGNVAEMTAEKGTAKGGSWSHSLKESRVEANIPYNKPEKWLGFRCLCSWNNPSKSK